MTPGTHIHNTPFSSKLTNRPIKLDCSIILSWKSLPVTNTVTYQASYEEMRYCECAPWNGIHYSQNFLRPLYFHCLSMGALSIKSTGFLKLPLYGYSTPSVILWKIGLKKFVSSFLQIKNLGFILFSFHAHIFRLYTHVFTEI